MLFNKRELPQERIDILNNIEFCWNPRHDNWEQRLHELKQFKEEHKHCNVPVRYNLNPDLGFWVFSLRRAFKLKKEGVLTKERVKELEDIGFAFSFLNNKWMAFFQELAEFKRINSHCRVPKSKSTPTLLSRWLDRQRQSYRKGKLDKDRQKMLDNLCLSWR